MTFFALERVVKDLLSVIEINNLPKCSHVFAVAVAKYPKRDSFSSPTSQFLTNTLRKNKEKYVLRTPNDAPVHIRFGGHFLK